MSFQIELKPRDRKKRLVKLLIDARQLGFNFRLIQNYVNQLNEVEQEIKEEKNDN